MSKPRLTVRTEMTEIHASPWMGAGRSYSFIVELYSDLGDRIGSLNPERVFDSPSVAEDCAAEFEEEWRKSRSLVRALEKVNDFME